MLEMIMVRVQVAVVKVEELPIMVKGAVKHVPNKESTIVEELIPLSHCLGLSSSGWPDIEVRHIGTVFGRELQFLRKEVAPRHNVEPRQYVGIANSNELTKRSLSDDRAPTELVELAHLRCSNNFQYIVYDACLVQGSLRVIGHASRHRNSGSS